MRNNMKITQIVVAVMFLAAAAYGQDNYIACVDTNAGLIRMVYGPTSDTSAQNAEFPEWLNVYLTQAEYQAILAQINNKPPEQQSISYVPAAKVTAAIQAARTEAADYDKWREQEKALARLFVKEINKLRALHGLAPYTAAQVKAALKAEMND